jgi:hypothetical protein
MSAEIYGRGLQIMTYANAANKRVFESTMKRYEKELGKALDGETKERLRRDMLDPSGYVIEIPKERTFSSLKVADDLAPIFFKMKWSLVIAEHGYFVTSDNPLVRLVDPKTSHPIRGDFGFYNKTAEVSLPLSPKMLLVMSRQKNARDIGVVDRNAVNGLNRARAANSERYLYAHVLDKRLQRLAAEFKESRPGMTTQGFGPKKFAEIRVPRRSRTAGLSNYGK